MAKLKITRTTSNKIGAVTFLDVLGWKGIWQRKDDPIQALESLRERLKNKADIYERGRNIEQTNVLSISDTIVLLTEVSEIGKSTEALDLHGQLCAESLFYSLEQQIPLRGATGYGEFSVSTENNIFVGKAIDETASWYEQADWIGVFMTPSAFYSYDSEKPRWWVKHAPPLKKELKFETYATVWAEIINTERTASEIAKSFGKMSPIIPEIITKFSNTQKFLQEIQSTTNQSDKSR
jgi:hypothetical protein